MWPVVALIETGGGEMVTCQTSLVSLHCILQDLEYNAEIPECKISSSQSSWSCWHQPWRVGERTGGGGSTWNHCVECFTLWDARIPIAPAWKSTHMGRQPGWAPHEPNLQQPGAQERRVSAGPSPATPQPNLCEVVQTPVPHALGVLHYQWDPGPVFPQLMGSCL